MTEYALLLDGAIREIRHYGERPPDIPHKKVSWHPVVRDEGSTAFTGLKNANWVIRVALPTLEELRAQNLAELAALRWEKETGGAVFNGMPVATGAVSQTKYIGAVVGAQIDPAAVINWKMADGTFVTLNAQAVTAVAMAVRAHVQACFDNEAALKAKVEAANAAEEIAAADLNTGWPRIEAACRPQHRHTPDWYSGNTSCVRPANPQASVMGSGRVRRHSHRRARSVAPNGEPAMTQGRSSRWHTSSLTGEQSVPSYSAVARRSQWLGGMPDQRSKARVKPLGSA